MMNSSLFKKTIFHLFANFATLLVQTFLNKSFEIIAPTVQGFVVTVATVNIGRVRILQTFENLISDQFLVRILTNSCDKAPFFLFG